MVVTRAGAILFSNEQYRTLEAEFDNIPQNVLALTLGDSDSTKELTQLINGCFDSKASKNSNSAEIKIRKGKREETDQEEPPADDPTAPSFFSNYEVAHVTASAQVFLGTQAVVLTFEDVSTHKAQLQMMSIHNLKLTKFVEEFKNHIESNLLEERKQAADSGLMSESLTKTLGTSYHMLSNLRQM